ncbi:MalY/PatB family protein [Corynebacterium aquatimens]|uniref:cysteine-S-conjugate beta-lyase n=1 Tax=Corynebacterium aquatimens TaxID=1190508 RepID=A0A931GRL1_9CORY|nr:aminotransferase class I/II-fold pyridoxal phosphate-dependent enzyme [Corynebacterium aquatimens]MBG6122098.1 cystathionine beta-lyase [Corynebacterium aquatimens]WJY65361.1 Cystathionine beta-lyase PatB [Corynebacterium aquatimens]
MQFPDLNTLRRRGTRKWTQYPDDVLPLWVAESDFPTAAPVKAAILDAVERETLGYTPAFHALGEALSDFHGRRYGWAPDPEKVFPVADVVRGMLLGVEYFTAPDSPVVVPVPAYPPFLEIPATAGREMIEVGAENGLDMMEIDAAFKNGAGSILLAAPNNPWGYTYDEEELAQLCAIADKYGARVLVDEIHAPIVYEGRHVCAAGVNDTAARVCLTVTATSKAWNIAGLKCAQMIFSNDEDVQTWKSLTGVAKDGTGTLGIIAAEACYRHGEGALDAQVEQLKANRDWLATALPEAIPGIGFRVPEATYLLFLDFSNTAIGDNEKPASWLRTHAKVALNEGVTFGSGGAHHARLNFATSPQILEMAVDRIAQAVASQRR